MLWRSMVRRLYEGTGQELYGPASTLPGQFFDCCRDYFGMKLHCSLFIGTRSSQVRGLFLGHGQHAGVMANAPLASIPLDTLYTVRNIASKPHTLPNVTLADVERCIPDTEFKLMAPQLYMGLQMSAILHALPDLATVQGAEDMARLSALQEAGAMPWARMLDDEDFDEEFVSSMYSAALDSWQKASLAEMTMMYHRAISAVHNKVQPPFSAQHLRRITRLVLARVEHLPPLEYYKDSYRVRRMKRWLRRGLAWARLTRAANVNANTELTLVPLLDLVNHSNRPNCAVRVGPSAALDGKPAVTLYSICPIAPRTELCRHYNFALSRPNALFRYGFLPFDLISIVEHDVARDMTLDAQRNMAPPSTEKQRKELMQAREVARLEAVFQKAKQAPR